MSVSPESILRQAETQASESDEAAWRTAVSRAYYAAFHAAQRFHAGLPLPGMHPPQGDKAGTHGVLFHQLKNPTVRKTDRDYQRSRQVGIMLASLHAARVRADYLLDEVLSQADAQSAVELARRIISICGEP